MYFSTNQYPQFKGKAAQEQRKIIKAAIEAYNKWANLRFWVAVAVIFGSTWLYSLASKELPSWYDWTMSLGVGFFFYAYLLFEINGPIYKAVQRYLQKEQG
jgi:hypothetical protein